MLEDKFIFSMCCKWCENCSITDLEAREGTCNLDIGELISNIEEEKCEFFHFNSNLERC